jgi:hypothetical protein
MQTIILNCDSDFRFLKLFKYAKHYVGLFIAHQPLVVMICVHMGCEIRPKCCFDNLYVKPTKSSSKIHIK